MDYEQVAEGAGWSLHRCLLSLAGHALERNNSGFRAGLGKAAVRLFDAR
jgi:hypothetical protein